LPRQDSFIPAAEVPCDDPAVNARECAQLVDRDALIDLVDGRICGAEFKHRAIVLDEARIRCSARSRQPRRCAGFLRNRIENYAEERPGLGNKGLPARRLDDSETPTELTHDLLPLLVDESHERLRGLFGAEPDIEFGRGMRRNYI